MTGLLTVSLTYLIKVLLTVTDDSVTDIVAISNWHSGTNSGTNSATDRVTDNVTD